MNAMMQQVNIPAVVLSENNKLSGVAQGKDSKDFKLILNKLSKDSEKRNDLSPLLILMLALNPILFGQRDANGTDSVTANGETDMQQGNIALDSANNDALLLLKAILPRDIPNGTVVPENQNAGGKEISAVITNGDNGSPQIDLSLLTEPADSDVVINYKSAEQKTVSTDKTDANAKNLSQDTVATLLKDAVKQTGNIQTDTAIPAESKDTHTKQAKSSLDKVEADKQNIPDDKSKEAEDFKTIVTSKSEIIDKDDLNMLNTSFKIHDESPANDNLSSKAAVQPKIQTQDIFRQIAEGSKISVADKTKSEAIINLKPPNLGKILMEISVDKNIVTARITTQNTDVKNIIESNINQLKDSLNQQGMHVDSFMVSVDNGGFWGDGHQQNHERHQRYFFANNSKSYEDYEFNSYIDKDHVDCIV